MSSLPPGQRIASAHAVFCGRYGDVTRLAHQRGVFRQTLYREAHAVALALEAAPAPRHTDARRLADVQAEADGLRQRLRLAVVLDDDKQAEFVATAQAQGVSLSAARALLAVLLGKAAPSLAQLGRRSQKAGRRATKILAVLDDCARPRARQV